MAERRTRLLIFSAGLAWLVVAGSGIGLAVSDGSGDWELPYAIFSAALLVAGVLTVAIAERLTRQAYRPRLRMTGLIVSGLGVALSFVAWATPVWMTVFGVGFLVLAITSAPGERRALGMLGIAHLAGLAVLFAGIMAEVGWTDSYGDYPVAPAMAVVTTVVITIGALFVMARELKPTVERPVLLASQ